MTLLPSKMRRGGDTVEAFQRQDRVGKLVGAALQYRAGQRQEFLLHRLRVRERGRLARRVGMEPFMHAVIGGDADPRAERMGAADFEAIVLHHVELVRQCTHRGVAQAGRNRPSRSGPGRAPPRR